MTTKYKIMTGFTLMVLMLVALAFLSYTTLETATTGFADYRRRASLNVITSNLDTHMNTAVSGIYRFLNTRNDQDLATMRKALDEIGSELEFCSRHTRTQEAKGMIAVLEKDVQSFRMLAQSMGTQTLAGYRQYTDVVLPAVAELTKSLDAMAKQAVAARNVAVLEAISRSWNYLAAGRAALGRFVESRSLEFADTAQENFTKALAVMNNMEVDACNEQGKQAFDILAQASAKVHLGVTAMEAQFRNVVSQQHELEGALKATLQASMKFSDYQDKQMERSGAAMLDAITNSQQQMLIGSVGGVAIGVFFALFIIYGIIRVLREAGNFATAVARGDFTYAIKVNEGGEIGATVAAMQQIPAVLGSLVEQAKTLTDHILGGNLRERLDASAFSGSFSDLTRAVNQVGDAFTNVIDGLGMPIMCCDKQYTILYLSPAAQKMAGNLVSARCSDELKAANCGGDTCFGARAMMQNASVSGETTIHPCGMPIDVAVTASPLHDQQGAVTGFMEVITDLSEIKAKQVLILRAARDAEEIANRVAAASEELATQVEEVSRGAERQRERVESTASAMTQMNASVLEVARNAGEASGQSENTRLKADEGAQLVNNVVRSINDVNTAAHSLQNNMTELGQQAESIGGVINIITDIADQTNLLALNAAIEAARAGEAGRGFAVVADEVRKLAEKTMQATQEVGGNIKAIQHSASANIDEVINAVNNIEQVTELANASGQALRKIVELAAANSSVVASIAAAAEEQSATSEEINRAIDEINRIAADTTNGMMQSAAAVQDLSQQAQELQRVMEGLQ